MSRNNDRNNITDDNVQNGEGHTYVGGSNTSDMELDERDMQLADDVAKEKKIKLVIALSAVLLAIIAVVVYFAATQLNTGKAESVNLVSTYMEGLGNSDVDKVKSVMDSDTVDDDSISTLVKIFQTYNDNGIQYTLDYTTGEGYEASDSQLDAVSKALYNKTAEKAEVKKGYVVPVKGTILLTYDGQTSPYDVDMDIICYEKDGEWYLGGTVESGDSESDK